MRRLQYGFLAGLLLLLGVRYGFCFATDEYRIPERWQDVSEKDMTVEGIVTGKEDRTSSRVFYLSGHLLVYDSEYTDISIGSKVRVSGEANSFSVQRNPGGFDEQTYYGRKKYWAKLYAEHITVIKEGRVGLKEQLFQCRRYWSECLRNSLGEEQGGILASMLLGDKGYADAQEKEWYQKAGLGHLLAISGFHVGFFGAVIFAFFRKLRIPLPGAAAMTGMVLGLYVLLCNTPDSALRAYIMYMVLLGAGIAGRDYRGIRALLVSALVILLLRPMDIADAGFLLSFGAMFGIQVLYPIFVKGIEEKNQRELLHNKAKMILWDRVIPSLMLTLSVQLMILPLILYFYYELPVYSFLAGLPVTAIFSALMAAGVSGCLLSTCQGAALSGGRVVAGISNLALYPAGKILDFYSWICRKELQLPFSRWVAGQPKLWQILLYYIVLFTAVLFYKKWKRKRFLLLWLVLPGVLSHLPVRNQMSLHMVDVGQGDCFVIEGPQGVTYMIDGGSSDQNEPARYIIEPFLKSQGIAKVDYVLLTHGDADHVCGILEMMERKNLSVDIENLVLPSGNVWDDTLKEAAAVAENQGIRVLEMCAGDSLTEGELNLEALYPEAESTVEPGNDASLVLDVHYKKFSALLTGDLGEEGEARLLKEKSLHSYTVLKAGHHGSKYASTTEFLEQVQPAYVLISAGVNNRYGHPAWEMLERAEAVGAEILRTDQSGAVKIWTDGEQVTFDPNIRVCYDNSQ
jgi:competence protein ComEC